MDAKHMTMVTVWPANQVVSVACGGCGWARVVDFVGPPDAVVATRRCQAKGLRHEKARRLLAKLGRIIRNLT
jgi:hypothetical protein